MKPHQINFYNIININYKVLIYSNKVVFITNFYMARSFQNRLSMKLEPVKRKLLDNLISFAGSATDCIRVTFKRNKDGDLMYADVKSATVDSIIFPKMPEVPLRRIYKDGMAGYKISPVSIAEDGTEEQWNITIPYESDIDVDDLIIRVYLDPANIAPTVLTLIVTELTGTIGENMVLETKAKCTLFTEQLRPEALAVISEMAKRRLHIGF